MRVFVCPLDWGLGHAARCIPIIRYLIEKKAEVIIGAEGAHLIFLKEHFPNLEYIEFPGYRISYSAILPVGAKILLQLPQMVSAIKKEHELLTRIVASKKIDAVISDNRYGLWNKKIPCVIITHQLNIQAPAGSKLFSRTVYNYIKHFDECWIPDYEEENLSGVLSHPIPKGINGRYIGPLSRFAPVLCLPQTPKGALSSATQSPIRGLELAGKNRYDLLLLLSGPEPQRSILEELILKQLKDLPYLKALIIQGLPGNKPKESSLKNVEILPHLADAEFLDKINCSDVIISRPGYSTLMDLHTISVKKAILIPTPGQTEQEYLGKLMQKKGLAVTYNQKGFSLKDALDKAKELNLVQPNYGKENHKGLIDEWLGKILLLLPAHY